MCFINYQYNVDSIIIMGESDNNNILHFVFVVMMVPASTAQPLHLHLQLLAIAIKTGIQRLGPMCSVSGISPGGRTSLVV